MNLQETYKTIEKKVLIKYEIKGYNASMTLFANLVNKYDLSLSQVKELKEIIIKAIENQKEEKTKKELQLMNFTCNIF